MDTSTGTTTRDYSAEFNAFINERLYVTDSSAHLARTIFDQLLELDPDLLDGWVAMHALDLVKKAVGDRHRAVRAQNRQAAMREPILKAKLQVADAEARMGNLRPAAALSTELSDKRTKFLTERYIGEDGNFIVLGEMKRAERRRVANYHDTMGRAHLTRKAFMLAIDERCGADKATGDIFTEEDLSALWRKLNGVKEVE